MYKPICRIISFLLAISSAVVICGCGSSSEVNETDSQPLNTDETFAETTTEVYESSIAKQDFGGETITFLTYTNSDYQNSLMDIAAESYNGEVLNDAIFDRNNTLIEKFNIDIEWIESGGNGQAKSKLASAVLADTDEYDIYMNSTASAASDGFAGYLMNMNDVPYIDLDKPWWNSQVARDTSILGQNYFYIGDMSLDTWTQSYVVYFSKQVAEDYSIPDLYDIARRGEWTFERLDELTRRVYSDLNGNGEYDENDLYGLAACSVCIDCFWASSGVKFISKNQDDIPELLIQDSFYDLYEQMVSLLTAPEMLYTDRPEYTSKRDTYDRGAFIEDRALFFIEGLCVASNKLREMESDYGIIPLPKYDLEQENYITFSHTGHNSSVALPITLADDAEMLGMILEDMAYYSMELVRPAYYENMLNGKLARDEESIEMLDIITSNISYDLGFLLINSLMWDLRTAITQNNPAGSFISARESNAVTTIQKAVDSVQSNISE